jgi:hypothetical protein
LLHIEWIDDLFSHKYIIFLTGLNDFYRKNDVINTIFCWKFSLNFIKTSHFRKKYHRKKIISI